MRQYLPYGGNCCCARDGSEVDNWVTAVLWNKLPVCILDITQNPRNLSTGEIRGFCFRESGSVIHLKKVGRRIEVRSRESLSDLKSAVPGAYHTTQGYWTVPLSIESCVLLRQKYGNRLVIGTGLLRWATNVRASRSYMERLGASRNTKLRIVPRVAPKLAKALAVRTYQRVGARFIAENTATLVADDPGLGKTLQCLAGILESETPGPYLVVAPKTSLESVWQREITRWLPTHRVIVSTGYRYQRERILEATKYGPRTWIVVNPEMVQAHEYFVCTETSEDTGEVCEAITVMRSKQAVMLQCGHQKTRKTTRVVEFKYPELFEIAWGVIVVDEAHDSLLRRRGIPTQRRRGLELLQIRSDGLRIAMSGTPFDNKPHLLWGTLNWLDPKSYGAFHRWAELFWQKGGYTGFEIGEFRKDRESMLWDSLSGVALRRTKAEVATDLPPKMEVGTPLDPRDPLSPVGVWLEMRGKQAKAYREIATVSATQLKSGRLEAITALAELTRLKQLASCYGDMEWMRYRGAWEERYVPRLPSNKFDWILEHLEEWGYPDRPLTKIVIVSFYTGILDVFAHGIERYFRTKPKARLCTAITGRTRMSDRAETIRRFNREGNEQIMMLNVRAGGTAITIDSADRMIFISETGTPDQQKQAEDRIHRVSNPRQCMYYYLRSLGTVDVGTAIDNQQRIQDSHRLLDQRRGIDYVRHVLDLSTF